MKQSDRFSLTAKISEFCIPPVQDGLVLGKQSPIGPSALSRALELLVASDVEGIEINDDIVGHIFVRKAIIRRIPREKLITFVLERVKPLMGSKEILHLDLEVMVTLQEDSL